MKKTLEKSPQANADPISLNDLMESIRTVRRIDPNGKYLISLNVPKNTNPQKTEELCLRTKLSLEAMGLKFFTVIPFQLSIVELKE